MTRFRFIAEEAAQFPVSLLCRVMDVTRGGFYAWKKRPPSARALADAKLSELVGEIHDAVLGIYGAPRIHAELKIVHGREPFGDGHALDEQGGDPAGLTTGPFVTGDGLPNFQVVHGWFTRGDLGVQVSCWLGEQASKGDQRLAQAVVRGFRA